MRRVSVTVLALVSALSMLHAPAPAAAQTDGYEVVISPEIAGNRAVRPGQPIAIGGSAPDGATISGARLIGVVNGSDGPVQQISPLNQSSATGNYLLNDGGTLRGRITPNCAFGEPGSSCDLPVPGVSSAYVEVVVGGLTLTSDPIRIDYTRPRILRYDIVTSDTIVAVFDEPVRLQGNTNPGGDQGADWTVMQEGQPNRVVVSVATDQNDCAGGGAGCTRRLRLATPLGEDDEPRVVYEPAPTRVVYEDFTNNLLLRATGVTDEIARDRVRPPVPSITRVAGVAPSGQTNPTVAGTDDTPAVDVGNLTGGHTVFALVDDVRNGPEVQVPEGATTTTIELVDALSAGLHEIAVVARDPNGNRSDDASKSASRANGTPNPVDYVLDTAQLPVPSVTMPAGVTFTQADQAGVSGGIVGDSAGRSLAVDIYRRPAESACTDTTETEAIESAPVSGGTWSATVDLEDGRNRLQAAVRDTVTGRSGSRVCVPDIVRDNAPPTVDVSEPSPRDPLEDPTNLDPRREYGEGANIPVTYTASDPAANDSEMPDHGVPPVAVALHIEGGNTIPVADGPYAQGEPRTVDYQVDADDLGGATNVIAHFTATTTDRAGNPGSGESAEVRLRTDLIGFTPRLTDNEPGNVAIEVDFPVPVSGSSSAGDWRADNGTSTAESSNTNRPALTVETVSDTRRRLTFAQPFPTVPGDPNAVPFLAFVPGQLSDLAAADGREIQSAPIRAIDDIDPALTVNPPPPGVYSATTVPPFDGTTDASFKANTVNVHRTNSGGSTTPVGAPLAAVVADDEGNWAHTAVPMDREGFNHFVVVAVDPTGNTSPNAVPITLERDTLAPAVSFLAPTVSGGTLSHPTTIRWRTNDAHANIVKLEYRENAGAWQVITDGAADTGSFDWTLPGGIAAGDRVDLRITATDRAGNVGQATASGLGLGVGARIVRAVATSPRTVDVFFAAPVETDPAPAGFSIVAGPGVREISGSGVQRTLTLSGDLSTTTPEVSYTGRGVRDPATGEDVPAARIVAERGFVFPVTGVVAGESGNGVRISFADERNRPAHLEHYEVRRGAVLVDEVEPGERSAVDATPPAGTLTYQITAHDDLGNVSTPVEVELTIGPGGPASGGEDGGTGRPPGVTPTEDCGFPSAPNIGPEGGSVLSCDGETVVLVPAGAVAEDHFARLITLSVGDASGYAAAVGEAYQLVAVAAADGATLHTFSRFAEVSFRPGQAALDAVERARLHTLRHRSDGSIDELAVRAGLASASTHVLTLGTFGLAQADGASVRIFGPDPAIASDRFATAVGLSQSSFAEAGAAVIARADDYPDALAAGALAAQVGGPVLLSRTEDVPMVTELELQRLGVEQVVLVGGTAALSDAVAARFNQLGYAVDRVSGPTRFDTAVAVAQRVGAFSGQVFLAVGTNFADALSASSPSAYLTRPIMLTAQDELTPATLAGMQAMGVTRVQIVGGTAAVSDNVANQLSAAGITTERLAGSDRYATAVALATALAAEGVTPTRPILASGEGDGRTSPDALAAGPVASRAATPLLLTPRDSLHEGVAAYLRDAGELRGIVIAGGPVAVSDGVRTAVDATRN